MLTIIHPENTLLEGGLFTELISRLILAQKTRAIDTIPSYLGFKVPLQALLNYCEVQKAKGELITTDTPFEFWNLYQTVYQQMTAGSYAHAEVSGLAVWLYADIALLNEPVPQGLPGRLEEDGQTVKTFKNWYHNPKGAGKHISSDYKKVILSTNVAGAELSMTEVVTLLAYAKSQKDTFNTAVMHELEVRTLKESPEFMS